MNIFLLDEEHTKNVQSYVDKHVVKMILEHVQMLSTTVRHSGIDAGYKATHINHPCNIWTRSSLSNWRYLKTLTEHLHDEWQYRFEHTKTHKSFSVLQSLPEPNINDLGVTQFAMAMPDRYKSVDAVESYRAYYRGEKGHIFSWKRRDVPKWLIN